VTQLTEAEARRHIHELLEEMGRDYTWVTGKVELHTRAGEKIAGTLRRADDSSVLLATASGERRVAFRELVDLIVTMSSPGPE
jgi:hypothetical protein